MKAKWTPGRWNLKRESNSIIGIRPTLCGFDIAHVLQPEGRAEQKANARLIAESPNMAELLADIASSITEPEDVVLFQARAKAILARIEKETT